ncbi:sensor histidine kinase [bacterium]|nr:sensor histidine kinase [bacterium]
MSPTFVTSRPPAESSLRMSPMNSAPLSPLLRDMWKPFSTALWSLNLLIEDLLSISKMESRARLLELDSANLHDLMLHVLENLATTIAETKVRIQIEWPEDARIVQADSRRMEQVYLNLLTNALRYGDSGDLVLSITAKRDDTHLTIAIADNGPGIPLSAQPFIFDRFYRVHKDRSRDGGGTGLGLSIVKNIILAHGGTISVDSTPGHGATFHIRLPVPENPLTV